MSAVELHVHLRVAVLQRLQSFGKSATCATSDNPATTLSRIPPRSCLISVLARLDLAQRRAGAADKRFALAAILAPRYFEKCLLGSKSILEMLAPPGTRSAK